MNHSAIHHFASLLIEKVPSSNWDFRFFACNKQVEEEIAASVKMVELLSTLEPNCGAVGCAIGHARAAFPNLPNGYRLPEVLEILGIEPRDGEKLFGFGFNGTSQIYKKPLSEVTAADVGHALLRYAEEGAWWR